MHRALHLGAHLLFVAVRRALALMAAVLAVMAVIGLSWGAQDVLLSVSGPSDPAVTITGTVDGLTPGRTTTLHLTLRNPGSREAPITVVRAVPTDSPRCAASYVTTGDWHGAIVVPANGSADVALPITVSATLPARCAGAAWRLDYSAQGASPL
jgi:hypothetical protein